LNVQQLVDAVTRLEGRDALACKLTPEEWKALAPYLSMRFLRTGEALMEEGQSERELYFLADGELEISMQGNVVGTLAPGAVVGEGTFFSGEPRSATIVPSKPGVAWGLHWEKFDALSVKQPKLAANLCKGLAGVLAIRMREAILIGHFA
jgi:CRP/FNR family cyclic AMP-dependent transcriptional regulator